MMSEKHPTGKHLPHPVKPVLLCSLIGAATVALLLAGFLCAKLHGRSGLLTGAACGVMVFGIIFLTGCLTMGGALGPSVWLKGLIFLFCGAIGGVLGVNTALPVK